MSIFDEFQFNYSLLRISFIACQMQNKWPWFGKIHNIHLSTLHQELFILFVSNKMIAITLWLTWFYCYQYNTYKWHDIKKSTLKCLFDSGSEYSLKYYPDNVKTAMLWKKQLMAILRMLLLGLLKMYKHMDVCILAMLLLFVICIEIDSSNNI